MFYNANRIQVAMNSKDIGLHWREIFHIQKPSADDLQNAFYNCWLNASLSLVTGDTGCFVLEWMERLFGGSIMLLVRGMMEIWVDYCKKGCVTLNKICPITAYCQTPLFRWVVTVNGDSAAEWGMGAAEKVYRRLLLWLRFDQEIRRQRLLVINHLYNFRVRTTGICQIRSYFCWWCWYLSDRLMLFNLKYLILIL